MTGIESALIIGAAIVVAFTFGFIFGMSYQSAEDKHEIRHLTKRSNAIIEEMKNKSIQAIEESYRAQDKKKKEEMISLIYGVFDDEHIKYGGF